MRDAVWHDLECHGYTVDLQVWQELAAAEAGPVLDIGAGTGRVTLDLAAAGHEVVALDIDRSLLETLEERAAARGLEVGVVHADAQEFALDRAFGLILVPMQTIQMVGDRMACLRAARKHLAPGGLLALAIAIPSELMAFDEHDDVTLPDPDAGESDGWRFESQTVAVRLFEHAARIERVRTIFAPDGQTGSTPHVVELATLDVETLEQELTAVGLTPQPAIEIPATTDYVGTTVVLARG